MRIARLAGGLMVAGSVMLTVGCASTDQIEQQIGDLRALAEQAQAAADKAQSAATNAQSAAAAAQGTADSAMSKAEGALSAANDANNCCRRNTEKMDRMFEKSMRK